MGTIRVGQKSPKTVAMGGFTIAPDNGATNTENKPSLSAEEKSRIVKNIMQLPKDQIVPALRKHGFNDIADSAEAEMKKEAEEEANANARKNRLAEIMAMSVEEQLPLLLADGYEDEAKELSERLAAEQEHGQEKTDDGTGEENIGTEAHADGTTSELNDNGTGEAPESAEAPADAAPAEEPKKKKGGRPKKTESK